VATTIGGSLHDAEIDGSLVPCGCFADRIEIAALYRYALVDVVGEQ